MRRARWTTVALCAALLATTACKKDEAKNEPQPVSAPAPLGEAVVKKTDPGAVDVRVIDAGREPRRQLRYVFREDMRGRMTMEMRMRMSMSIGPQDVPEIVIPPVRVTMSIDETDLTDAGNLRYKARWEKAEVVADADTPKPLVEALETEYAGLAGMTLTAEVTPSGVVTEIGVALPTSASQQAKQLFESMEQALRQIMAPLPSEPVGSGASWLVVTTVDTPILKVTQEATYELVELAGDTLDLTVSITQKAPPQDVVPPGMPPGTKVRLERLDSSGTGTTNLDLTSLVPHVSMKLTSSMAMEVEAGGDRQPMRMKMGVEAVMGPAGR